MLSFVHNWFAPGANPVGIDFGADFLRLAQVERHGEEFRLVSAAVESVPRETRDDPDARHEFFTQSLRNLWIRGKFRGRQAVLALPAANTHIQHLRLPRLDDDSLRKALPWETQGKMPIDPSQAIFRHVVAGDVYADNQPRSEVIVVAAHAPFIEQLLAATTRARIAVVAMPVQSRAIIDCFLNTYRRKTDIGVTSCLIDLGASSTRAIVANGGKVFFARSIPLAAPSAPRSALVEELILCRRYHESTFPSLPIQRLIFVGGGACDRELCQAIARDLGIAAQVGDPLVRMGRTSGVGIENGIDRRQPQPAWAVAIGLSMGPPAGDPDSGDSTRLAQTEAQ